MVDVVICVDNQNEVHRLGKVMAAVMLSASRRLPEPLRARRRMDGSVLPVARTLLRSFSRRRSCYP